MMSKDVGLSDSINCLIRNFSLTVREVRVSRQNGGRIDDSHGSSEYTGGIENKVFMKK